MKWMLSFLKNNEGIWGDSTGVKLHILYSQNPSLLPSITWSLSTTR